MQINLTQKERMMLEDQKNHEQICIEKYSNYANQAQCSNLKQIFRENEEAERVHLGTINQLLNGTVPQINQQQGQQQAQQQSQASSQEQNMTQVQNSNNNKAPGNGLTDKEMCTDVLMTEKYVSGEYDTAIFEFTNPQVRQILNHIQKEEQQHGEKIFNYMQSNGMYNVQ